MKRNISDLLREIPAEEWKRKDKSALSERRIRQRTMNSIGQKQGKSVRWVPKVALIAAVLVSMLVTAFAAETIISENAKKKQLMGGYFGTELSDKQVEQMEDIGKTFGQSVTSFGSTITTLEAIADENTMYLYLKVEADENVVLPDLKEDQYYSFTDMQGQLPIMKAWSEPSQKWVQMYVFHRVTPLPDADPTDNVKEFVVRFEENGNFTIFNGPWKKVLNLPGLYIHSTTSKEKDVILRGSFEFDVTINDENRNDSKLVIEVDDAKYHDEQYGFVTTVSKVTITPLRIDVECKYTDANDRYIFPSGGPVELVMKDGTVIKGVDPYLDARESGYHPDSIVAAACMRWFDVPIVVEDIDYIRIGDDYIADVN